MSARWALAALLGAGACSKAGPAPSDDRPPAETSDPTSPPTVTGDTGDSGGERYDTGTSTPFLFWESAGMGTDHACGLVSDGSIRCWGRDYCTSGRPSPTDHFKQLSVGHTEACGVRTDGRVQCWCCTGSDEVCTGVSEDIYERVEVTGGSACAVDAQGLVTCWGGGWTPPFGPVVDLSLDQWAWAILADGTVDTWGDEWMGGAPPPPDGWALVDIAAGDWHACGLDAAGAGVCWGEYAPGGGEFPQPPPGTYVFIESSYKSACAIALDGTLSCWGNEFWWFGIPPVPFAQVSMGTLSACGVDTAGQAWCWGQDPAAPEMQVPSLY
jgi:hypothetical protein